jgi:hypothetical protein
MTGKPKFLKTWDERLGRNPRQFIDDIVYIYGPPDAQSKGGHAKAEKSATALKSRNQKIRAEFVEGMKVPGAKRHKVVAALAKKHERSTDRINRILRHG